MAGVEIPEPPDAVRNSVDFRVGMIQIRLNEGDVEQALTLSDSLLAEGLRTPDLLLMKAEALQSTTHGDVAVFRPGTAAEIERLTTETIDGDPPDDTLRRAYLARAVARRALGRSAEAEDDLRRARDTGPTSTAVLLQTSQLAMIDGHYDEARRILIDPAVERYPLLLALRAHASGALGDADAARKDVQQALQSLADALEPDSVRLACAEAALACEDAQLVERSLIGLSRRALGLARYSRIKGRLAFQNGDTALAIASFEEAAARDEHFAPACYAELGILLWRAEQPAAAVDAFEKADPLPAKARSAYVRALIAVHRLAPAQRIVEEELKASTPEGWALDAAAQIAMASDDIDGAVAHLQQLIGHPDAMAGARIHLARLLVQLERPEEAEQVVSALRNAGDALTPREQMALAQVLHTVGRSTEALDLAFSAFRRDDDDAEMHKALATLALFGGVSLPSPTVVTADSHVKLSNSATGESIEYTIYRTPPVKAKERQILASQAENLKLMGARVGDSVPLKDTWGRGEWTVVEIKPALQHVVQDVLANYEDRFPDAPFFIRRFSIWA